MNLTKLSVNMNDGTRDALKWLALEESTSYTEVVRKAISLYHFYKREQLKGSDLVFWDKDKEGFYKLEFGDEE